MNTHDASLTPSIAACEIARLSRDARFDGVFFTAVLSTRIYCRPVCPARPPKPENVVYYPSAAAAQAQGFRPCLRCRPELAPGNQLWQQGEHLVSRGAPGAGGVIEVPSGIAPRLASLAGKVAAEAAPA